MKHKKSRFNFVYNRAENEVVIYNTYSKALVVLDNQEYKEFDNLTITSEEIREALSDGVNQIAII